MILNFTPTDDYPIRPYVVELANLYDDEERKVVRIHAIGEADVRSQVRSFHPGYFIREMTPMCVCGHNLHAGPCRGGASTSEGRFIACGCAE